MLPRSSRLRKRRDFRATMSRARQGSVGSALMSITVRQLRRTSARDVAGVLRFGFSISKKVAKRAHDRNRIKRRLSELARTVVLPGYRKGASMDCVVVARAPSASASFVDLRREFLVLLQKTGILRGAIEGHAGPMRRIIVAVIRIYQRVSRYTPAVCRFTPSCSEYAAQAVERFGAMRGTGLALRRLLRCHPWNAGGYDPIPEASVVHHSNEL
jgi:putative membrane protein insertion efficiency factor/ribonuclease P protein component